MENTKKKLKYKLIIKKYIYEIFQIAIGTFVMAVGTYLFLLPNKLSSGGLAGIATITYYLFDWNMGTVILLLNIPFFLLAFIRIGKEFVFKSIIGTTFLSFFIDILDKVKPLTNDRFLACIYGGIIIGIGTSIVLKVEGSTGGSDLLSYIIKSFKPGLLTSNLIVMFDSVVILLNVICFKQLEIGLYSAISIYLMGKIIDIIFEGIGFSKMVFIISKDYNKISNEIGSKVTRGVTGIYSKGMYTDKEKMMLMCIASRNEIIRIRQIANQIDSRAFIVITNVREVYGKGFK